MGDLREEAVGDLREGAVGDLREEAVGDLREEAVSGERGCLGREENKNNQGAMGPSQHPGQDVPESRGPPCAAHLACPGVSIGLEGPSCLRSRPFFTGS